MRILVVEDGSVLRGHFVGLKNGKPVDVITVDRFEELEGVLRQYRRNVRILIDPDVEMFKPGGETEARLAEVLAVIGQYRKSGVYFVKNDAPDNARIQSLLRQYPGTGYISTHPKQFNKDIEQLGLHY